MSDKIRCPFQVFLTVGHESCPGWHEAAPDILAALATKYLRVNATEDGIEFVSGVPGGTPPGLHMIEPFDDLATAAIHGQGSYNDLSAWASTLPATSTINVAVKSGADKMLTCTSVAGEALYESNCTFLNRRGFPGGRISFKMRTSNIVKGESGLRIMAAGTVKAQVYFRNTGQISYWNNTTVTNLLASANNTWYQIDLIVESLYCWVFIGGVYKNRLSTGTAAHWNLIGVFGNPDAAVATTTDYDDLVIINSFGPEVWGT